MELKIETLRHFLIFPVVWAVLLVRPGPLLGDSTSEVPRGGGGAGPATQDSPGSEERGENLKLPADSEGGPDAGSEEDGVPPAEKKWYARGFLDLLYRFRSEGGDEDQDLEQYASLSFGETGRERIAGHVSGLLTQDLDGTGGADPFASIHDTYGGWNERLYSAYVDLRPEWGLVDYARLGRQWLSEVPDVIRLDGVKVTSEPLDRFLRTRCVIFCGLPDQLDETSRSEDRCFGGGVIVRPLRAARFSAFYARVREDFETEYVAAESKFTRRDDMVDLELRSAFLDNRLELYGGYSNLNGSSRDLRVRVVYESPCARTCASLKYRLLFETQNKLSSAFDPYVSVIRTYRPFHEISFSINRELTEQFGLAGGVFVRRLKEDRDIGAFNHEFERYYLQGTLTEWPFAQSELAFTASAYDTGSDRIYAAEGVYSHLFFGKLTADLGSGYELYKEDRFVFEEREDVRTAFLRLGYDITEDLKARTGYSFERGDRDTTHVLEFGLRIEF